MRTTRTPIDSNRRKISVALASAPFLAGIMPNASAQAWPARPVTFVSPVAVGGSTDRLGRAIASGLAELWGQAAVVDSKPGAGGSIAAGIVAKAAPDGYTALVAQVSLVQAPSLLEQVPYDLQKDFIGVTLLGTVPVLLAVRADSPLKTLQDYIGAARAGQEVRFGSFGAGSSFHIYGETLAKDARVKLVHVPYKGESAAVADLLGGHIESTFVSVATALPLITAGRLRPLAVVGQPVAVLPGVPGFPNLGFPRLDVRGWFGFVLPRGVPRPIVEKMSSDIRAVAKRKEVVDIFQSMSGEMTLLEASETDAFLRQEANKWRTLITELGIKT